MVLLRAPLNVYFNLTNYPYFRYDSLHDLDFNLFSFTKIKLITLKLFRYAEQLDNSRKTSKAGATFNTKIKS